ncbi:MAG TPA: ATP-binding protein [Burkholderiales bacterium]|nr:ATP-binding protein [Burkholderiales bacterium]
MNAAIIALGVVAIACAAAALFAWAQVRRLKASLAHKDDELAVQRAFHRAMMDTIPSLIMLKDADARIYDCNRTYEEAFGFDIGKLKGRNLLEIDFYPKDVRERMYADDKAMLASPGNVIHNQTRLPFPNGEVHDMLYWKTAFLLPDGRLGGLLGVMVDVSDIKKYQQAAMEAKELADAANRAKGAFLATMSHEIRTPMNAVLGMLELLSLSRLDDEQRRQLDIVRESSKALLRIIDDILDFSKIEAGKLEIKPEAMSVADAIDGAFLIYVGVASSKNLLLKKRIDGRISPALRADPLRLRQILNNFTSNALKFTDKGEVELGVELIAREAGAEKLRFSVRDTGIGISPENRARLFQPFMQAEADTTRRFGGTGLGLAICRRLAELMGGEIAMESEVGVGTTLSFTVTFPIADRAELETTARANAASPRSLTARRKAPTVEQAEAEGTLVLLADDHPTNRLLLVRQLGTLGYAAEAAEDGAKALEKWKSGRFALLITDCHMPEMDGYQLTREIRRIEGGNGGKRFPIVACTANALQGEAEICFATGMDDYVSKPVEMRELLAKLDRWLPLPEAGVPEGGGPLPTTDSLLATGVLAEISGGDKALEREILADFRQSAHQDVRQLKGSLDAQDSDGLRRAAHRMKGASRMVGALDLASVCEALEHAGRDRDMAKAQQLRSNLSAEIERLDEYLQAL